MTTDKPSETAPRAPIERRAPETPKAEIEARIAAFQQALRAKGIEAALVTQNADLFYLSGTVQQSHLYVPADGEPTLFVRKTVERARAESPLAAQVPLPSLRKLADLIRERHGALPQVVGAELDVLPVNHFRRYESLLPEARFVDIGPALVGLRAVKSPYEIERIRASAAVADELCSRIPAILKEGMTEAEFAGRVEAEARALGHQGVIRMRAFNGEMFYGQLLSGTSGAVPSYLDTPLAGSGLSPAVAQGVSLKRIGRGEPIVFDFVPVIDGYVADFTRMFVIGKLQDERLIAAYACARRAQDAVRRVARPGVACRTIYEAALAVADEAGLGAHFMGHGPAQVRFIGHGLGLELDELPILSPNDRLLQQGMVFACEPKFVFPGVGAIGIENTWVVTTDGIEPLTLSPEELYEL